MNSHQRRIARRSDPRSLGCGAQFFSGTTPYPDLSCYDTRLIDDDADGFDPSVWRRPCPNCRPDEHAAYIEEMKEQP